MKEVDVVEILTSDPWRKSVIDAVSELGLPNAWVAGGFVRNTVWDHLYDLPSENRYTDIDVIYFKPLEMYDLPKEELIQLLLKNETNPIWEEELVATERLTKQFPDVLFEVKNQARMYLSPKKAHLNEAPYRSVHDAVKSWVETATATGIQKNAEGSYSILAPFGLQDLSTGIIRPVSDAQKELAIDRAQEKGWLTRWPQLKFEEA